MHAAQLQQRRIEILYHKFPEIFRGIIPEKYRYFSGKIPRKFPEISELTTLLCSVKALQCRVQTALIKTLRRIRFRMLHCLSKEEARDGLFRGKYKQTVVR